MSNAEDSKLINLNEDEKVYCLNKIKEMYSQLSFMHQMIEENELSEEMRDTLSSLIEHGMSDISEKTGYDSLSKKVLDEKFSNIRVLNTEIRELRNRIGSDNIQNIKEKMRYLSDLVYKWWKIEGFRHVSNSKFLSYGNFNCELCIMFHSGSSRYSDKPVTDKEKHKTWLEEIEERGFEVVDLKGNGKQLIDNDHNRELLKNMIINRIPSAEIVQFKNWNFRSETEDVMAIKHIEIVIRNLEDIKNLESYISKFKKIDEEY